MGLNYYKIETLYQDKTADVDRKFVLDCDHRIYQLNTDAFVFVRPLRRFGCKLRRESIPTKLNVN